MRVVVVGAGVSGLVAARSLASEHEVVVVERSRSVGGRLATRRIGAARLDHGAQFFTVREAPFRAQVDDWLARGLARVWCHGFDGDGDGFPRYVGADGMNSLAKDIAAHLPDVRTGQLAFAVRPTEDGWDVVIDDGATIPADAVVLTCPVAQSWALLVDSEVEVPAEVVRRDYFRTIALLAVLDRPSAIPAPGAVQLDPDDASAPFAFVGDNQVKGISTVPAVTFHATRPWSADHWDDGIGVLRSALVERARPFLGDAVVMEAQVKRWRFAGPVAAVADRCWVEPERRVVLAGDLFAGPKVEGAYLSGLAAAAAVRDLA